MVQSFPKQRRLRSRGEFLGVQQRGRRFTRGSLLLVVAQTIGGPAASSRLGLVVSRKVGNAVRRNAFKRWIREWFRTHQAKLPCGLDLVVIGKPGAVERGHVPLCDDLAALVAALPHKAFA